MSSAPAPNPTLHFSLKYQARRRARKRLGPVHGLPLAKRASGLLLRFAQDGMRVLEVGAGDRRMKQHLLRKFPNIRYESLDPDPEGPHEYRTWDEVQGQYDLVFAFEVLEHIPAREVPQFLWEMRQRVKPGGWVLLSTPNVYCPHRFLYDATHCTPLCYDEFAGLVELAGLEVQQVYRTYHEPWLRKLVRRWLFGWLFRVLMLDYAPQIVLVARRPNQPSAQAA